MKFDDLKRGDCFRYAFMHMCMKLDDVQVIDSRIIGNAVVLESHLFVPGTLIYVGDNEDVELC